MSSLFSSSVSLATSASHLDAYNDFATQTNGDKIIIGVKDGKPITASNSIWGRIYQTFFGNWNKTIIEDFNVALKEKYDESIATFAFPDDDQKEIVRTLGLDPKTIQQVIKKAQKEWDRRAAPYVELVSDAEEAACLKSIKAVDNDAAQQVEIKASIKAAKIISEQAEPMAAAQAPATQLDDIRNNSQSPNTIAILPDDTESLSATLITTDADQVENTDSTWCEVSDALKPITPEAFRASLKATQLQHQKLMNELLRRIDTNPTELEKQLTDLVTEIVTTIEKHSSELKSFSDHFDGDASDYFHIDASGAVVITRTDAEPQPTEEENKKIWQLLFSALEGCYGKPSLEKIVSHKEREEELFLQPLTIARAERFFAKSQAALAHDLEFLKSESLIITQHYLDALAANPELFKQALETEQQARQAGGGSTSQLGMARHLHDVMALAISSHVGPTIMAHAGPAIVAATGTALGPLGLAIVIATICGAGAGIFATRKPTGEIDHSVAADAATRSATYNIGSIFGPIVGEAFLSHFHGYIGTLLLGPTGGLVTNTLYYLYHSGGIAGFAADYLFSAGGSYGADGIRDAFVGGMLSGAEVATTAPHAHHDEDISNQVAFESRLIGLLTTVAHAVSQLPHTPAPIHQRTRVRI